MEQKVADIINLLSSDDKGLTLNILLSKRWFDDRRAEISELQFVFDNAHLFAVNDLKRIRSFAQLDHETAALFVKMDSKIKCTSREIARVASWFHNAIGCIAGDLLLSRGWSVKERERYSTVLTWLRGMRG